MSITNAKHTKDGSITATFDGVEMTVPVDAGNRHYTELMASGAAIEALPDLSDLPYAPSDLTPRRFEYLLAYTGLDDVWVALEAELKTTDRATFAQIKAQRKAMSFSQEKTLALVAMFAATAQSVAPDADLSEDAIKAAWIIAEGVTL